MGIMNTALSLLNGALSNWRTSFTAFGTAVMALLTVAAALPAQLGDLSTIIPEPWKPKIVAWCGLAAVVLHVLNGLVGKDARVTGNGSLLEPFRLPTSLPLVAAFLGLAGLMLVGCAVNTGNPATDARGRAANAALAEAAKVLGNVAVSSLLNVAQQEMGGGKVDFGSAAAEGLWSNAGAIMSREAVGHIVAAYSAGKLPATAKSSVSAFAGSMAEPEAKAQAIASVISTAAGAPPAK